MLLSIRIVRFSCESEGVFEPFCIGQPVDNQRINEKTNFYIAQFPCFLLMKVLVQKENRRTMSKQGKTIQNFMVVAANSQG
jgi:hypothetical protein